jgi:hypothetical protein
MTRRELLAMPVVAGLPRAAGDAVVRVSPRCRRYLELSDGSPYLPIGLNMVAPREVDLDGFLGWMEKLGAQGGNYARFWLSHPVWDLEPKRAGVYDEAHAAMVERALQVAKRQGIRVKMTIEHFRSTGGGPQPWADKALHNRAQGGTANDMEHWLANEESRAQFRGKIAWLARRFGERPEIFGWELWNEINAVRGKGYLEWTEAMLPVLHKAFPRQLCMQSLGSFDNDPKDGIYQRHSTMAGNDLALVHRYLDLGAKLEVCHGPVDVLAADAVRTLLGYRPDRPVLLAESGGVEPKHTGPFRYYANDKQGTILHDVLFAPFFAGAAGPGQIWHWDVYVAKNDLWWQFGRFAEFVKGLDCAAEEFEPSVETAGALRVYRLKGRRTTLWWVRDGRNDWRAELERGEAPSQVTGAKLNARGRVRFYDPWTNQWSEGEAGRLPDFRRSLCVRT